MELILTEESNLFKLAKGMDLLRDARIRRVGYLKFGGMDKSALWFSHEDQKKNAKDLLIIERVIDRLESYCRKKCYKLAVNM